MVTKVLGLSMFRHVFLFHVTILIFIKQTLPKMFINIFINLYKKIKILQLTFIIKIIDWISKSLWLLILKQIKYKIRLTHHILSLFNITKRDTKKKYANADVPMTCKKNELKPAEQTLCTIERN